MPSNKREKTNELIVLSESPFDTPEPAKALTDPEGLSAVGGDLSSTRLIHLYSKGFFPWFSEPDPILWWHPENRCVLQPQNFHTAKSLRKAIKKELYSYTINQAFTSVIEYCSDLRKDKEGTWISKDIQSAYFELHQLGYAHSIEIWQKDQLIGGFYGVAMGKVFFGESMFSLAPNASKIALKAFCDLASSCQIELIDCQVESEHLLSLGAELMPRSHFCEQLKQLILSPDKNTKMQKLAKESSKYAILP